MKGFAQERESWLKLERKGKGYGFDHIVVERLGDRSIMYQIQEVIRTDIAGFNPQEITQDGRYVVDLDMHPVSLDLFIKFHSKKMHVKGNCINGVMYLTAIDDAGFALNHEIPFQDVYFEVVVGNVIFRKRNENQFRLKIFNPLELKVNEFQVEVKPAEGDGIEATLKERITMKYLMDRRGRVRQIEFVELNSRSYLTNADDARNIDYLNTADGFTLTVKPERALPNIYKITQAQIKVKWQEIPFEEFKLEDNRQKLLAKSNSGKDYEAVLEVFQPPLPSNSIPLPFGDDEFAPFLGDTQYIKPSDPSIQQKLADIQKDQKDAYWLVQKMLLWVYDNIKGEYIVETLTGPEVLQRRKGKCSEYATLFASLSRAAGIPTRIVFGEAVNGNRWIGHLWCEVWLGEWMAVDAAMGTFVAGPSHIKFIDSATVMGTQKIRWKLVDNLSLEILDYKEKESNTGKDK
jgi:hypothetical protein